MNSFDPLIQDTAILFFSLCSQDQAAQKQLLSDWKRNVDTASILIRNTENTIKRTGLPIFHSHKANQNGRDFGEKLSNAIQEVFEFGFQKVIVIGNDTPKLNTRHIHKTKDLLEQHRFVLGPTHSGGLYIIGIRKDAFKAKPFISLPWGNSDLANNLMASFHFNDAYWLKTLSEINNTFQLRQFLKCSKGRLKNALSRCIDIEPTLPLLNIEITTDLLRYFRPHRAPPTALA
ncbi:MAG: DUF2064 domain-containing protein [Flavobacteriales bacterium]|nr:DUF2064 domain-containing protein [Flavobacteriales bacterium]